jgi:hypothetical protein
MSHIPQLKRILNQKELPVSKRTRQNKPILSKPLYSSVSSSWISATEFDNFCKNDKISDWLSCIKNDYIVKNDDTTHPLHLLFQKGTDHELQMVSKIKERTGFTLDKHSSLPTSRAYSESFKNQQFEKIDSERVLDSMKRGDNIIYSAYLQDDVENIRGIPDLLVRNDYIPILFSNQEYDISPGHSIFGNYYYIPVEIKFSSVYLNRTGTFILNKDRTTFYKTQLFTYCKILSRIQGVLPQYSFIIGKRSVLKSISYDPLVKPGFIDYHTNDSHIINIFYEGLEWLRLVKKYGRTWILIPELFPNMKVVDPLFYKDKLAIASEIGEITEIWQCNTHHRENAFRQHIYSWKDHRLTADILGVYEQYKPVVDQIIKVNRGELGDYFPSSFTKNTNSFIEERPEIFVDFETVRNSLELDSHDCSEEFIFLIGVWKDGEYKSFQMKWLSKEEETRVLSEFYLFWVDSGRPKVWFWYAEACMWKRATKRNDLDLHLDWVDLYQVFRQEPFVVKGCMNFKLKSYIKSLKALGKIDVDLQEGCANGLEAMMIAWNYYNEDNKDNQHKFDEMIQYNRLDCVYLETLLKFIRNM